MLPFNIVHLQMYFELNVTVHQHNVEDNAGDLLHQVEEIDR